MTTNDNSRLPDDADQGQPASGRRREGRGQRRGGASQSHYGNGKLVIVALDDRLLEKILSLLGGRLL